MTISGKGLWNISTFCLNKMKLYGQQEIKETKEEKNITH